MPRKLQTVTQPTSLVPSAPQPQTLTEFQEFVCDLAADLIINGGDQADVSNLLRATIGHSGHLQFPERDTPSAGRINENLQDWRRRLSRQWPAKTEPQHALPKTVSQMARANVRTNLRRRFEDFLGFARLQDLYLLNNVFGDFDSCGLGPEAESAESHLAEAFMQSLDSDHTYVKVPRDYVDAVEEFLAAIEDEDDAPAKAPIGRSKLLVFPKRELTAQEAPHAS